MYLDRIDDQRCLMYLNEKDNQRFLMYLTLQVIQDIMNVSM